LDYITSLLNGNKQLAEEPGVVYALTQQKAHPAEAGAINEFMTGLNAEKQVTLARQQGQPITLADNQKTVLNALGVNYADVEYNQQDAANDMANYISQKSNGALVAKRNTDGTLATDANGQIVTQAQEVANGTEVGDASQIAQNLGVAIESKPHDSGGLFGHLFHTLNNDILKPVERDVLSPAGTVLMKPINLVNDALGQNGPSNVFDPSNYSSAAQSQNLFQRVHSQSEDMQAKGYDPNSIWSQIAYRSSGKSVADTSSIAAQYGQDAVNTASAYINDPEGYRKGIENDPASYTTGPNGQTLTPEATQKLNYLSSDEFKSVVKRVGGSNATIGNQLTNDIGLAPGTAPYALTSAGLNLAAAFMIDPFIVSGKLYSIARTNAVGMGLDFEKVAKAIDPAGQLDHAGDLALTAPGSQAAGYAAQVAASTPKLGFVSRLILNNTQRRLQDFINTSHAMADAQAAGDKVLAAGLSARIATQHRELAPLVADILGKNKIVGFGEEGAVHGSGDGIYDLRDMASYVASKSAYIRLLNGTSMRETALMPGAISGLGFRWLRGNTSQWMTERAAARSEGYYSKVGAAAHDPALADKLVDDGMLERFKPTEDDATVALTGQVLADKKALEEAQSLMEDRYAVPEGEGPDFYNQMLANAQSNLENTTGQLASAKRAIDEQVRMTPAGQGMVARNVKRYGDPLGDGNRRFGWSSPLAMAERSRQIATRLSTNLPRNTLIDINDAQSADKVFKIARYFMNKGDAERARVAWNLGDGGQRKAVLDGIRDQLAHSAGLTKTESGQRLVDSWKAQDETYSAAGDKLFRNGSPIALSPGQTRDTWLLPDFRQVQMAASKIGWWESSLGRGLTSYQADALMSMVKMGWLFKPSTVTRNDLEGWLNMGLRGVAGDAIKARSLGTMRNAELWKMGYGQEDLRNYQSAEGALKTLEDLGKNLPEEQRADHAAQVAAAEQKLRDLTDQPIVQHYIAGQIGDTKLAKQLERGALFSGQALGRSKLTQRVADNAVLALVGRAYQHMFAKTMDDRDIELTLELGTDQLSEALDGFGQQATEAAMGLSNAAKHAAAGTQAGYPTSQLRMAVGEAMRRAGGKAEADKTKTTWTQVDLDNTLGADRYSIALRRHVNPMPGVAKVAIAHLEYPDNVTIDDVVKALEDPSVAAGLHKMNFGTDYWAPGGGEAMRATTPEEVALGKRQMAQEIVNNYKAMLTDRSGAFTQDLADYITEHGAAPDSEWITRNMVNDKRPAKTMAPEVMAMPAEKGLKGTVAMLQDVAGAGYQWGVERPLARQATGPAFLAGYLKVRRQLDPMVEQLVETQGISREAATALAQEVSMKNAWVYAEKMIDDPGQRTQFDIVARNFFPFSRATVAMIRRWGGGLYTDPARARKMMLAYEGATQSGLVYDNAYGEPTFTYPGSGVMNSLMQVVAKIPGFENLARFPVSASLTGGVLMSVPGADNPLRMGMGPMITIPMREIKKLLPGSDQLIFDEVDSALNGPVGQGQTFSSVVPAVAKRFLDAMDTNSRDSALASSMVGALANLAAAGRVPAPDAPASVRDAFIQNLRTQVRTQLFLRAAFGIFAPAAPSQPSEGTAASQADYAFNMQGVGQLSDEYKQILNDVGGNLARATAIWTAIHPDQVVYKGGVADVQHLYSQYTQSRSAASVSKISVPSTDASLAWMTDHDKFIRQYGSVAPYFLPAATGNDPFSENAYRAQLALGMRQRKTPTEFYEGMMVRNAEAVYYPSVQQFDTQIDKAKASGDSATVSQLIQAKSDWEKQFKGQNPLFGEKTADYSRAVTTAMDQLGDLEKMAKDGSVPNGEGALLQKLLTTYHNYSNFVQTNRGNTSDASSARSQALAVFNNWVVTNIKPSPLRDLFDGVFRPLNTNLVNLSPFGASQ
jgi:hypothetical protein